MSLHGTLPAAIGQLLGLTVFVAAVAGAGAFLYRWGVRERLPDGLAVLIGLSVVAVSVGATTWLNQVIGGSDSLLSAGPVIRNIGVFVVCAAGAVLGARAGDRVARDVAYASGTGAVDGEVGKLVEAVGRVITVELPADIDDVVGYDPVPAATKTELEGKRFLFPRRLTVAELRERLVARLETDYAVGHVDMELATDGSVEYLALGSRAAGIGPTLPPETAAVAVRADPAYAASAGDLVQVWETNPTRRVLTAELRGVAGDVATLAIDAADTPKLDADTRYRLVTLPVDDRPDREFASLLRAADETMATVEVREGSAVAGRAVRELGATVVAIAHAGSDPATLPVGDRTVAAGDVLYAMGTPEALRKLETAAEPADPQSGGPDGAPVADEVTDGHDATPADADPDVSRPPTQTLDQDVARDEDGGDEATAPEGGDGESHREEDGSSAPIGTGDGDGEHTGDDDRDGESTGTEPVQDRVGSAPDPADEAHEGADGAGDSTDRSA